MGPKGDRGCPMAVQFILSDYMSQLMAHAVYDKLDDGTFSGRIPERKGVLVFGAALRVCEDELRSESRGRCGFVDFVLSS
jgi:hypothetical protein